MKNSAFYLLFSLWSAIIVIIGFWPKYFGQLMDGIGEIQWIIHIHAMVFTGWIILFFLQALAIYKGRTEDHIRRGKIGMYYGLLVLLTGLVTAFVRGDFHRDLGDETAAVFSLAAGIRDVVVFGIMFAIAMYFRKKPQLHRIWIMGAASYLLVPAVARANGVLFPGKMIMFILIWLLPVFAAMFVDYRRKNRYLWNYVIVIVMMIASGASLGWLQKVFAQL